MGRTLGDALLRATATRLHTVVGQRAFLARTLGGEFALWCAGADGVDLANSLARELRAAFLEPFLLRSRSLTVTLDFGIAQYQSQITPTELLQRASQTIDWAKHDVGGLPAESSIAWYNPEMGADLSHRLQIVAALAGATERGEMTLAFQPVLDLQTQTLVGCEALLRWSHPTLGTISPAHFIPIAEQAEFMEQIGGWVLDQAITTTARWRAEHGFTGRVSINISATQLLNPQFGPRVFERLEAAQLPVTAIELELVETAMLDADQPAVRSAMLAFDAGGLQIAIDDFGTGYSSLLALQRLPLGKLKIPMEFVRDMLVVPGDLVIVRSTVQLAHALGLIAQAEGVETSAQADALRSLGCDLAQGYLFGRPESESQFIERFTSAQT